MVTYLGGFSTTRFPNDERDTVLGHDVKNLPFELYDAKRLTEGIKL